MLTRYEMMIGEAVHRLQGGMVLGFNDLPPDVAAALTDLAGQPLAFMPSWTGWTAYSPETAERVGHVRAWTPPNT
jgi:hypothetical protein